MGHPRKPRKKYDTPPHPWNAERIKEENRLLTKYGLKNKKEIWKAETMIRRYRRDARHLLGLPEEHTKKEREQLLGHLKRMGILADDAKLEDVLNLTIEDVLKRRLQTMVYEKGFARTIRQARQMIIHGHITLDGSKVNAPSYLVKKGEEDRIGFYPLSPMIEQVESKAEDKE